MDERFRNDVDQEVEALRGEFGQGFDLRAPAFWRAGLVFASPHSGHHYPKGFVARSPQGLDVLRRNEDALVDSLFGCAPRLGAPLLTARFPRCFVDVNRAGDDLPPEWRAAGEARPREETGAAYRARIGLGVVPLIISDRVSIYRTPPTRAEALARIEALYRPYHRTLAQVLDGARRRFGSGLLLDCHSMPGSAVGRKGAPGVDIVLGDAHGRAASAETIAMVESLFASRGYRVARNHPYAGGFATLHYGRPEAGIEAVQIEINRDLYLDTKSYGPGRGYAQLARDLEGIVGEIVAARMPGLREAAE